MPPPNARTRSPNAPILPGRGEVVPGPCSSGDLPGVSRAAGMLTPPGFLGAVAAPTHECLIRRGGTE